MYNTVWSSCLSDVLLSNKSSDRRGPENKSYTNVKFREALNDRLLTLNANCSEGNNSII